MCGTPNSSRIHRGKGTANMPKAAPATNKRQLTGTAIGISHSGNKTSTSTFVPMHRSETAHRGSSTERSGSKTERSHVKRTGSSLLLGKDVPASLSSEKERQTSAGPSTPKGKTEARKGRMGRTGSVINRQGHEVIVTANFRPSPECHLEYQSSAF